MSGTGADRETSRPRSGSAGQLRREDDRHLPWLEADEEEEPGIDTGRAIAFALIALVVLGVLGAAGWWFLQGSGGSAAADGSTIEAPDAPYKVRPEDPGGKVHLGTGDLSFAVGEGRTRKIRVGQAEAAAVTEIPDVEPDGEVDAEGSETEPAVGVQVGAFSSKQEAQRGWSDLLRRIPALDGVNHRILEGQADIGTVFRLQAVAPSVPAADDLCQRIKAQGGACEVKH
ncbi:SPOR domain-containing protein [Altericroceibacterium xinjiangense]|uniref:SPOR domain-containing protein n=1 Tax=Altericroceibacterium xinjiangense TaxID=762261 RepID=UPI000F7F17B3|nr:SPOR domain-containing protein [Altericroceibacterium xinjiangense]